MKRLAFVTFLALAAAGTACGSSDSGNPANAGGSSSGGSSSGGSDAGGASGAAGSSGASGSAGAAGSVGYPAPHPPMPVAQKLPGSVMASPKVVTITFDGDPLQASIDSFVSEVAAATEYWTGATSEYGVGALTVSPPVHLSETPPTTTSDLEVQQWLTDKINTSAGFPQPDANTMYAIFYPDGSNVTLSGGNLCGDYQGYHSDYPLGGGKSVAYIVVGRCPPPVSSVTALDEVTAEASHELIEAATDPLPNELAGWTDVDGDHKGWALVGGGAEIGDLCAPFPGVFYKPTGVSNLVQRVWSNAAAAASHDPCEPDGVSPYFNSAPVLDDDIQVVGSPLGSFLTKGALIPIGSSKTIELDLYSDGPTSGPWTVTVLDLSSAFFGGPPALSFDMDKTQGQNGDKIQLTIHALAAGALGTAPFWIQNDLGGKTSVWIGLVGND